MANRCTLHKTKLEAFKSFLDSEGIAYRPGKGDYQALQVQTNVGWKVIFERNDMPEHFSVNDKLMPIVRRFLDYDRPKPPRGDCLREDKRRPPAEGHIINTEPPILKQYVLSKRLLVSLCDVSGRLNKHISSNFSVDQEKYLVDGLYTLLVSSDSHELRVTYEKKAGIERISLFEPFFYINRIGSQSFSTAAWEPIEDGFILYSGGSNGNTPFECKNEIRRFDINSLLNPQGHFIDTLLIASIVHDSEPETVELLSNKIKPWGKEGSEVIVEDISVDNLPEEFKLSKDFKVTDINPTGCEGCPFYEDGGGEHQIDCRIEEKNFITDCFPEMCTEEVFFYIGRHPEFKPDWCPLKNGPVIVRLK